MFTQCMRFCLPDVTVFFVDRQSAHVSNSKLPHTPLVTFGWLCLPAPPACYSSFAAAVMVARKGYLLKQINATYDDLKCRRRTPLALKAEVENERNCGMHRTLCSHVQCKYLLYMTHVKLNCETFAYIVKMLHCTCRLTNVHTIMPFCTNSNGTVYNVPYMLAITNKPNFGKHFHQ